MSKIAVVYWSGSGNTAAMAEAVLAGARAKGEACIFTAGEFSSDKMDEFDAVIFGCPAMGAEELEEGEMAPLFDACKPKLAGKKIGLFGSYGWGDGEWMRNWDADCRAAGADMPADFVICNDAPDDAAIEACKALGTAF